MAAITASPPASRAHKVDQITDWDNYPLRNTDQINAWYRSKVSLAEAADPSLKTPNPDIFSMSFSQTRNRIPSPKAQELYHLAKSYAVSQVNSPSHVNACKTVDSSRIRDLMESQSNLYF